MNKHAVHRLNQQKGRVWKLWVCYGLTWMHVILAVLKTISVVLKRIIDKTAEKKQHPTSLLDSFS